MTIAIYTSIILHIFAGNYLAVSEHLLIRNFYCRAVKIYPQPNAAVIGPPWYADLVSYR